MKAIILGTFLLLVLHTSNAQQNNLIVIGSIDSIHSNILNEKRKIWVHLPESYPDNVHSKAQYPAIYLLDAEWNFRDVVGMVHLLSSVNGNNFCPEVIVVGITNTNRMRDLTPTKVTEGLWVDSNMIKNSGGGEAFLSFIEKELIPHIDSLYPTTTYRMLIGHSLGGLLAIQSLVHHKDLFSSYVAIDPSMWWDKQMLLTQSEAALKKTSYTGTSIFLGMAHTQPEDMDTVSVQKDTTSGTLHPRSIILLSRYLMNNPQNGLEAHFKYYSEETHTSSPLMTTYDAIHSIFKNYSLKFQDSYFTDSTFRLAAFIEQYYARLNSKYGIKAKDGTTLLPPEEMVNNLGHFVLTKGQFSKAAAMFTMNADNYPSSPEVYSAMGDLYAAKGEKIRAINNYKRSLSIKEDADIRKKMNTLSHKLWILSSLNFFRESGQFALTARDL